MALSLTKSVWSAFEVFASSQLNAITTQLLRAVDGTGGGTYNPSSVIAIGGSQGFRIEGTGTAARLKYSSRSVTRGMPNTAQTSASGWSLADDPHYWQHDDATAADRLNWHLVGLPHNSTLSRVTVRVNGSGGTKPTTMPTARLYTVAHIGGTTSPVGAAVTDPSTNDSEWQLDHTIEINPATVIDTTLYSYFVAITGSNGSTGVTRITGLEVICTITEQSEYNP